MRSLLFFGLAALLPMACSPDTFDSDAGVDGSSDDGQVGDGAGGDATSGDAGCNANDSFCSAVNTPHGFCADFDLDLENTLPSPWNDYTNAGYIRVVSNEWLSCPHALGAMLPLQDGGVSPDGGWRAAAARGAINALNALTSATLELDAYLPSDDHTFLTFFALVAATSTGNTFAIGLSHHAQGWYLDSSSTDPFVSVALPTPPPANAWSHMKLDVPYNDTTGTVSLSYVDASNDTIVVTSPPIQTVGVLGVSASVGLQSPGVTENAFTAYYDNVQLTTK